VEEPFAFYKLYLAVRHHANQIDVLQVQQEAQNGEMANAARLKKSPVGTFYVPRPSTPVPG